MNAKDNNIMWKIFERCIHRIITIISTGIKTIVELEKKLSFFVTKKDL